MKIPVLETARLILREARLADFPAHDAIWPHPRTRRHFAAPYSQEDVWLRFLRNFGQWHLFGYGNWGIEDKAGGRYAGVIGFFQGKRTLDLPFRDQPEAGWVLAPDLHGQGLAREALTAALAWSDANIEAPQSWCMIDPENKVSRHLAEGAGYREAMATHYKGEAVQTFLRPRGGTAA